MFRHSLITLLGISLFLSAHAQFQDNFADGNFTTNPEWQGDASNFVVDALGQLQLNDADFSEIQSYLSAAVPTKDSTMWEFYAKLDFAPSSGNQAKIYLTSNSNNLEGSLNGYFVQLGDDGSADAVKLYKQTGTTNTLLISGAAGAIANQPAVARVRVVRNASGVWKLYTDYTGSTNYTQEGTAADNTHPLGNFFGVVCKYSSTRKDKMFFDDFRVSPIFVDATAPSIVSASAVDGTHIDVLFDESLSASSANTIANYTVTPSITVTAAAQDAANPALVHLTVTPALTSGQVYQVLINGVRDLAGNSVNNKTTNFTYYNVVPAAAYDIVINEIFADPTPQVGLPDQEFVELYNRSNKVINLAGLGFSAGSTPQILPTFYLLPNKYVILCDDSDIAAFQAFGDVVAVTSFPAMTNGGDDLSLTDANGTLISAVSYTDEWYQNTDKAEGGWTLELINPNSPCEGASNWSSSVNINGGTPGKANSVLDPNATAAAANLVSAFPVGNTEILLQFDQLMDLVAASTVSNYTISDGISIASAIIQPSNSEVSLLLSTPLQANKLYTITVKSTLKNCAGAEFGAIRSKEFGLASTPETGDVVINEILFNPQTNGVDFVELYNRSNKIINLSDLKIANNDRVEEIGIEYLLLPQGYVVLTENSADISSRYTLENPSALLDVADLPTFDDDAGNVSLLIASPTGVVRIDDFNYTEDYHNALLDTKDGVSLERIDYNADTQNPSNWHSAAASVGYATPTYRNSQFFVNTNTSEIINVPRKTFSPDEDGTDDVLFINYAVQQTGFLANITVFDAKGRKVKGLVKNELLATTGTYKWDGVTDDGEKARLGIYVLFIELFDPSGNVERFRETCVLAGKLN